MLLCTQVKSMFVSHVVCTRVDVHNLAQVANWPSLVKTSLELQSCPLYQINRLEQNPIGLLPLVKSINLKEGTRLQLQRRFYQTPPICNLRQIVLYPSEENVYAPCCCVH
jgi:hypothetical protein